jgi:hypothetical protein
MVNDVDDQIKVFKVLNHERVKFLLVGVAVAILITLFVFFLIFVTTERYKQCYIVGGSDLIFAAIITIVYKHYFKS